MSAEQEDSKRYPQFTTFKIGSHFGHIPIIKGRPLDEIIDANVDSLLAEIDSARKQGDYLGDFFRPLRRRKGR